MAGVRRQRSFSNNKAPMIALADKRHLSVATRKIQISNLAVFSG
jgi:hypothetical protein